MSFKYLYIDDASDSVTKGLAKKLSSDNLFVEYRHVSIFDQLNPLNTIEIVSKYDGLILDLRLDQETYDGRSFPFTATEFAQHIRTLVTKGDLKKDIPIVVFSTERNLKDIYFKDMTSNNLFDRFITKKTIPKSASTKLFSLANGYSQIRENKKFNDLLQIDSSPLDERIFSRFLSDESIPTHEYAQVILKDLIYAKGVLIDEQYLAARLGVDIEHSTDWENVKIIFDKAKYNGVFADGWERWWMFKVDEIFSELAGKYLSYLNAKEKIEVFKKNGFVKLMFAEPILNNHSYRYWVVCKALNKPLDPMEGFKVYTRSEPKAWQEYEYISLEALRHPSILHDKNIKPHPSELENIRLIISGLKK